MHLVTRTKYIVILQNGIALQHIFITTYMYKLSKEFALKDPNLIEEIYDLKTCSHKIKIYCLKILIQRYLSKGRKRFSTRAQILASSKDWDRENSSYIYADRKISINLTIVLFHVANYHLVDLGLRTEVYYLNSIQVLLFPVHWE